MNAATDVSPEPVRIIVFAKAPRAGFAKTRLIPALGAGGAAALATRLLLHTLHEALQAQVGKVELCRTPLNDPLWHTLPLPQGLDVSDQEGGDLGERLARAAHRSLSADRPCILIGTDCPALDAQALRDVAAAMRQHDAVIVPASDGGYVALGLRAFVPSIFTEMAWSTEVVAQETESRLWQAGLSVHRMRVLHDIDEAADLQHLPTDWTQEPSHADS
jgi:uncharacterized protein